MVKYEPIEDPSPAGFARRYFHSAQSEGLLSYGATFDAIVSSQYSFVKYEIDAYLLSLMKVWIVKYLWFTSFDPWKPSQSWLGHCF